MSRGSAQQSVERAPKQRLEYLDALRGIAALTVMAYHFVYAIEPQQLRDGVKLATQVHFNLGIFGVALFFLISGYVIPYSLNGRDALPRFAVSRFFRLYPAYWFAIALMLVTALALGPPAPGLARIAANLTMVPKLFGQENLLGIFWTLFIELIFYGTCAGLYLLGVLRKPWAIMLVALGGIAATGGPLVLNGWAGMTLPMTYLPYHISFLFTGYLLRLAVLDGAKEAGVYAAACIALQILLAPWLQIASSGGIAEDATPIGLMVTYAATFAVFVAVVIRKPVIRSGALLLAGAWSYSIYLLHIPAGRWVKTLVQPGDAVGSLLYFVGASILTLALAAAVYRWIERPSIDLGRRIAGHARAVPDLEIAP